MDEITLFAELAPSPPAGGTDEMQGRVRARLDAALTGTGARTGATPVAERPRRRRRRLALGVGAAAVAACTAVVVPAALPGGSAGPLVTPAWAVQHNGDGTVTVALREVAFSATGLESALRAEGVPALVRVSTAKGSAVAGGQLCRPAPADLEPASVQRAVVRRDIPGIDPAAHRLAYVIHPAAMPTGSVLYISVVTAPGFGAFTFPQVLREDHLPSCAP
jgi:hypothetical protein